MAFKKRFPTSNTAIEDFDDSNPTLGRGGQTTQNTFKESLFSDNFELKIDYKPDQAFDFEDYKQKILTIMEIFREDILNLKSNLGHLFTLADKHIYKDFHDLTNEFVALTQLKLETAISKSNAYAKNFEEDTLSRKVLSKLDVNSLRQNIRERLSGMKDDIESYLTEDKYYRKATFALSDLAIVLEKIFKIYDILDNENSIFNYVKVDEVSLYNKIFHDQLEITFDELVILNVPLIKERLRAENMYRTGAATTKERLMFRINDIVNKNISDFKLGSITSFVKTLLLREKFNLKTSLVSVFQKVLPEGLKLTGEAERLRKEITEELDSLKEAINYLEGHHKSYIKIVSGNINPDIINAMSLTVSNVDILIDIEKLFFIVQDITTRIKEILNKLKSFHSAEAQNVHTAADSTLNGIIETLQKGREGNFDLHQTIEDLFNEMTTLIQKEQESRQKFIAEKEKIDRERKEIEDYVDRRHQEIEESLRSRDSRLETKGYESRIYETKGYESRLNDTKETQKPKFTEERKSEQREPRKEISSNVPSSTTSFTKAQEKVPKYEEPKEVPKPKPQEVKKPWEESVYSREPEEKPTTFGSKKLEPIQELPKEKPKEQPKEVPKSKVQEIKKPLKDEEIVDVLDDIGRELEESAENYGYKPTASVGSQKKVEPEPLPAKKSFWEEENVKKTEPKDEKKKEKSQHSGFWDEHESDQDKKSSGSDEWAFDKKKTDPFNKTGKLEPLGLGSKKLEPLGGNKLPALETKQPEKIPEKQPEKIATKEPEKKAEAPKKNNDFWDLEEIEDDVEFGEVESSERKPTKPATSKLEPISQNKPAVSKLEPIQQKGKLEPIASKPKEEEKAKDPMGALFGKLEGSAKKEDLKKKEDEEIEEEYLEDFESSSPEKGLESQSLEGSSKKPVKLEPVQEPPKKIEEPPKKEEKREEAPKESNYPPCITLDKLDLVNEHIAQEAEIFDRPINPEIYNNLDVMIYLFQEFLSQMKLFIFDYPEAQAIWNEIGDDYKRFKRSNFPEDAIEGAADALKKYYLEMLASENSVSGNGRLFIPFAVEDKKVPFLVEIDLSNDSVCYIYPGATPNDRDSNNFLNEFHALITDIFSHVFEGEEASAVKRAKMYKVGYNPITNTVMDQFEGALYLKIMLVIYNLVYETDKRTKDTTILIDDAALTRFFCSLTSLLFLKQIVESPDWDQYSDYYLKMAEQLSDGKTVIIDYKQYAMEGNDYNKVENLLSKDLALIFGRLQKGLKEAYIGVDINQPQLKSVYYIYMTSEPDPQETTCKHKIVVYTNSANDPEFDTRVEKIVKGVDKKNDTHTLMYRDYLRHIIGYQFVNVTLGAWALLVKQNQFTPEEAMVLLIYNMNGYHLYMQQEGEGEEGEYGMMQGRPGEEGDEYEYDQGDELPIDEIDDNF